MAGKNLSMACIVCGTVLNGPIGTIMNVFGIHRSPQNPNVCNRCSTHIQEGSIAELTIFFADLVGFTAMTNEIGSQKSFEIINSLFKKASEILVRHDAFVDKFIGDAVMAIFNVPVRNEDHVLRAVSAAIEFQQSLHSFRDQFGRNLQFRISIASGYAHVGHIGSRERKDYTAIGEVVNLASRIQSAARPGEIILNDSAYDKIAHLYPSASVESIRIRGFDDEVIICRIQTSGTGTDSKEREQPGIVPLSKYKISIGSILFGLLGAPCVGVALLGPLAVGLGIGTLLGALTAAFTPLDRPFIQIPLHTLAGIGALANLYVILYGYRKRKKSALMQASLARYERIKIILIALASVAVLILIFVELYIHFVLGHHLGD